MVTAVRSSREFDGMISWLRRHGQYLDCPWGFEPMPGVFWHDQQFSRSEQVWVLLAILQEHQVGLSFNYEHQLVALRMALPFAVSSVMGKEDTPIAIGRECAECCVHIC